MVHLEKNLETYDPALERIKPLCSGYNNMMQGQDKQINLMNVNIFN